MHLFGPCLSGRFGERTSDWTDCFTVLRNSHASLGLSLHTEDSWKLWGFSLSAALTDSDGRHNKVSCNWISGFRGSNSKWKSFVRMSCSLFISKTRPPENASSSWPLRRAALAKTKWAAEYCVFVQETERLLGINLRARTYSRQWTDC